MEGGFMKDEKILKLLEILDRKKECLKAILSVVKEQEKIEFVQENDLEIFEEYIEDKEDLIITLSQLNQEYEEFIEQIGEVSSNRPYSTMEQQAKLENQEIISLSEEIQALEQKSRVKFEAYVRKEREKIKSFRLNNQMTSSYYKNMNGRQLDDSYFMDRRK